MTPDALFVVGAADFANGLRPSQGRGAVELRLVADIHRPVNSCESFTGP